MCYMKLGNLAKLDLGFPPHQGQAWAEKLLAP